MVAWWLLVAVLAPAVAQFPGHGDNFTEHCGADSFVCADDSCIPRALLCDRTPHCPDGSDEFETCDKLMKEENCTTGQFRCVSDGFCIPEIWRCDVAADCPDHSDELNCTKPTDVICAEFECGNGRCIPALWECDEEFDCEDHSDEMNCTNRHKYDTAPPARLNIFCNPDNNFYPCRDSSFCLPEKYVCDGLEHCKDGSDEQAGCKHTCENVTCSHGCLRTPTGPYCRCPQGFTRTGNETCRDVDECTELHDTCTQRCSNSNGGYACSCVDGYELASDKYTCRAKDEEGILFYNTRDSVMAYHLRSKKTVTVTDHTQQTVGVTSDGTHVYWTEVNHGHEAIMRAELDDLKHTKEVIVQSGLDVPEDVTVDWLTGVLYFTDSRLSRIGVCKDDGRVCAILIAEDIHRPRAIVLNPHQGQMYFSDWGNVPMIVRANMDGSDMEILLHRDLVFPNGLSLDLPNERLYWVDGHSGGIESSRLDGTDRQKVLRDAVHHPFWVSVFEEKLYWSDWGSNTLQVCEKFTGKSRKTIAKARVYGIHVYHPALMQHRPHACEHRLCSDLCLLRGNASYSCVCSEDRKLSPDNHTCVDAIRPTYLLVTGGSAVMRVQYLRLGRLDLAPTYLQVGSIGAVAYNNIDEVVYLYDSTRKTIDILRMKDFDSGTTGTLFSDVQQVEDMSFDHTSGVLYWVDSERRTVEVLSTRVEGEEKHAVLLMFENETPVSICLLPEYGSMLVALRDEHEQVHVDLFEADGSSRRHVFEHGFKGPRVQVRYHAEVDRIFISDAGDRVIESAHHEGTGRETFRKPPSAVWSVASAGPELFWTDRPSATLFWANVHEDSVRAVRRLNLDAFTPDTLLQLTSIPPRPVTAAHETHPCGMSRTPCSHICLQRERREQFTYRCLCPVGYFLHANNGSCAERATCSYEQLYCHKSNVCVAKERRCNGKPDCLFGEDEEACADKNKGGECARGQFKCGDEECIPERQRCDQHEDCIDGSDERDCSDVKKRCEDDQFDCDDSVCLDRRLVCDNNKDCADGSDEANCEAATCSHMQFQCGSGNCIPSQFECDGELDCHDGSDEHHNCPKDMDEMLCGMAEMRCADGGCVASSKRCDGRVDCSDASDEQDCKEKFPHEAQLDCDDGYLCETNKSICLPLNIRCDGVSDCPRGEDEVGCNLSCASDEFRCGDGRCIPTDYLCDGFGDCRDNSDEDHMQCRHDNGTGADCGERFTCDTGHCLDYAQVCDGVPNCADKSDEHGACETSCVSHQCEQTCVRTPRGALCRCRAGYKPGADARSCVDVDECADAQPVCAHLCRNTDGGFTCTCHHGYALRSDKRSCKALGPPLTLVYATGAEMWALTPRHRNMTLLHVGDAHVTDLAVNYRTHKVYFTCEAAGALYQVPYMSTQVEPVTNIGKPTKVAVDWISDNVYVADNSAGARRLRVCNVERRACAALPLIDNDHEVTALAVDPVNRLLFHCAGGGDNPAYSVFRSGLEGQKLTGLLSEDLHECPSLTLDVHSKVAYVPHEYALLKIHYEGTRQALPRRLHSIAPRGMTLFENSVYYFSEVPAVVEYCAMFGTPHCYSYNVHSDIRRPLQALALFHTALQPPTPDDPCSAAGCDGGVCVPADTASGQQCLCSDGSALPEDSDEMCPVVPHEQMAVFASAAPGKSARGSRVTIAVVVLLTLAVVAALLVLVYYRLRATQRQANTMNYAVHFSNRLQEQELRRRGGGDEPTVDITPPQPAERKSYTEFVNPLREAWRAMHARVVGHRARTTDMTHLHVPFGDSDSDVESDRDNDARDKGKLKMNEKRTSVDIFNPQVSETSVKSHRQRT